MSVTTPGIVVGVDGSEHADSALLWAWLEGQSRQVPVTAVQAGALKTTSSALIGEFDASSPEAAVLTEAVTHLVESLQGKHAVLCPVGADLSAGVSALQVRGATVSGQIVPGLLEAALDEKMLVVGRRGLGRLGRIFMGSVSSGLAREAQIPVTIVPSGWPSAPSSNGDATRDGSVLIYDESQEPPVDNSGRPRVVVGVDGSPASCAALEHGIEVARRTGAVLEAVACWQIMMVGPLPHGQGWAPPLEDYEEHISEMLNASLAAALAAAGPLAAEQLRPVVEHASPARGLLMHAAGAQRLIVGHRGHGGFDRLLLGSVSSQLIEHAPCPVTVIRTS